ncbi:hypothetical protein TTHERM_000847019 (macronuclear) [Tetrahymena thermophila SB210]|uniref:Uncharacterized protein n=1 Tax=Tetrahymena thermophila (strain SB210) TaxID=312017 RepID=W7X9H1_TETTS|nr:hypothetical protein TTHERM_000847019 [Tetrahymena thermophila SB210]EWS76060.1 hypothetical protein TTHERM_000847019 [Tetrahymena thermophila SB210]|eukprot:XP_012651411.1 hypothetical protein TTHERM_000847019 [Tetrahymena thermophila SB210]
MIYYRQLKLVIQNLHQQQLINQLVLYLQRKMQIWRILILSYYTFFQQIHGSTYSEYLTCYYESCIQLEQQCLNNNQCQAVWNQFKRCQNKLYFVDPIQQCVKQYKNAEEQNKITSDLFKCYDSCNGLNTGICNIQKMDYENCQLDNLCYQKDLVYFEKQMQSCLKQNLKDCEKKNDIICIQKETNRCMIINSKYSNHLSNLMSCKLLYLLKSTNIQAFYSLCLLLLLYLL